MRTREYKLKSRSQGITAMVEDLRQQDQDYIDQHPVHLIAGGHDFQFERRPITGGWDTGMWCTRCGSRMNQAPEVCPGRKA